jgi:hypothetical protein
MLEKNSPDSSWLMLYFMRAYDLPYLTRCEWKNGPYDSVYIMILFMCRMISDGMIAMETVCLWTVDVCYYGGCVRLVVTMCHRSSSCVLLGVVAYHLIIVMYYHG